MAAILNSNMATVDINWKMLQVASVTLNSWLRHKKYEFKPHRSRDNDIYEHGVVHSWSLYFVVSKVKNLQKRQSASQFAHCYHSILCMGHIKASKKSGFWLPWGGCMWDPLGPRPITATWWIFMMENNWICIVSNSYLTDIHDGQ